MPDDDYSVASRPPSGGLNPGVMLSVLSEYGGQTSVNIFTAHRFRTTSPGRGRGGRDVLVDARYAAEVA